MEVVLKENIQKLGHKGEIKNVKRGYFMNFLYPRGLAAIATDRMREWAKEMEEKRILEKEEINKKAQEIKEKIDGKSITFEEKVTKKDTLYRSIGEENIVEAMEKEFKVKLDKKQIILSEQIKKVGETEITVNLTDDITVNIKVEVKAADEK